MRVIAEAGIGVSYIGIVDNLDDQEKARLTLYRNDCGSIAVYWILKKQLEEVGICEIGSVIELMLGPDEMVKFFYYNPGWFTVN